ncbi:MAG: type III pantothenate kinase [Bacteroidia bacterium]|nr:type III pantothenate kinase [Bacteroidia bacterium]
MILTVDIGNTAIKCLLWMNDRPADFYVFKNCDELRNTANHAFSAVKKVLVSSVANPQTENHIRQIFQGSEICFFSIGNGFPFAIHYTPLNALGPDRLLAALGANFLHPGRDALIIDAGTCIKYGFLSSKNGFLGGFISPGIRMRFRALHEQTARLPLLGSELPPPSQFTLPGQNTESSMKGGVWLGVFGEVAYFIHKANARLNDPLLIFTGGDSEKLLKCFSDEQFSKYVSVKNKIFAEPYLIHHGLKHYLDKP